MLTSPLSHRASSTTGAFKDNVLEFLNKYGTSLPAAITASLGRGLKAWTVSLRPNTVGTLYIYQQQEVHPQRTPHCQNCRVVGWAHHPVCSFTYHFILHPDTPVDAGQCACCGVKWTSEQGAACEECGTRTDCRSPDVLSITRHRLHGVLHSNGFGHLLRICGREAGSARLSGSSLLELWDRICTVLRARFVSVEDVSTKSGLPLRVLHSIAHGSTWYGAHGYSFGRGGFGITKHVFKRATDTLHKFPLGILRNHLRTMAHDADDGGLTDLVAEYDACVAAAHAIVLAHRGQVPKHGARKRRVSTLGELVTLVLAFCAGHGPPAAISLVAATESSASDGDGAPHGAALSVDWGTAQRMAEQAANAAAAEVASRPPPPAKKRKVSSGKKKAGAASAGKQDRLAATTASSVAKKKKTKVKKKRVAATPKTAVALSRGGAVAVAATQCRRGGLPAVHLDDDAAARVGPWIGPSREVARQQLHALYAHLLESYLPAVQQQHQQTAGGGPSSTTGHASNDAGLDATAPNDGGSSKRSHSSSTPPGQALVLAAQVVHDTKLFVKDYGGEYPLGPLAAPHAHLQRVAVIPALDGATRAPSTAGWAGGRPNRRREPPSEVLLLPVNASVAELKAAATSALQDLYPCLGGDYVFHTVEGLALCGDRAKVQLKPVRPVAGAATDVAAVAGSTWTPVRLWGSYGTGPDAMTKAATLASSPLRYQGGVETWQVRCGCGVVDDDGERMFECSGCGIWKHTRCEQLRDDQDVPEGYACQACADKAAAQARSKSHHKGGGETKRKRK